MNQHRSAMFGTSNTRLILALMHRNVLRSRCWPNASHTTTQARQAPSSRRARRLNTGSKRDTKERLQILDRAHAAYQRPTRVSKLCHGQRSGYNAGCAEIRNGFDWREAPYRVTASISISWTMIASDHCDAYRCGQSIGSLILNNGPGDSRGVLTHRDVNCRTIRASITTIWIQGERIEGITIGDSAGMTLLPTACQHRCWRSNWHIDGTAQGSSIATEATRPAGSGTASVRPGYVQAEYYVLRRN